MKHFYRQLSIYKLQRFFSIDWLPLQALYLMPSSSARCAQFPRAQDKVHFYIKLRELRDQLKGIRKAAEIEEVNYTFDLQLAKGRLRYQYAYVSYSR